MQLTAHGGQLHVVLTNTTHPGNIGSAARAIKTMGLRLLRLANPKVFPSAEATALASGAADLLAEAQVYRDLGDAIADCDLVLGSSARMRNLPMPGDDAEAGAALAVKSAHGGRQVALVFGGERSGLTNQELAQCHRLMHINANPEYSSLNLAQAVQIVAYECARASQQLDGDAYTTVQQATDGRHATNEEVEGLVAHFETVMQQIGYLTHKQPEKMMLRLRRLFMRAQTLDTEVNILRGVLAGVQERLPHDEPSAR